MKLSILSFAFLLSMGVAQAESFDCTFTEPFVSVKYDTKSEVFIQRDNIVEKTTKIKNVTFTILGADKFVLKKDKKVIATLTLNNNGSDGMSDTIYPYEINLPIKGSNGLTGGCSSSVLPEIRNQDG